VVTLVTWRHLLSAAQFGRGGAVVRGCRGVGYERRSNFSGFAVFGVSGIEGPGSAAAAGGASRVGTASLSLLIARLDGGRVRGRVTGAGGVGASDATHSRVARSDPRPVVSGGWKEGSPAQVADRLACSTP